MNLVLEELQDICDDICNETDAKQVGMKLHYKFSPFIKRNDVLINEYERRLFYYRNLQYSSSYQEIVKNIHSKLKKLHSAMNLKHLRDNEVDTFQNYFRKKITSGGMRSGPAVLHLTQMCNLMKSTKGWYKLGDKSAGRSIPLKGLNDSQIEPWKQVFMQYAHWPNFIDTMLYKEKRIPRNKSNLDLCNSIVKDISILENMLKQPCYEEEIPLIEEFDSFLGGNNGIIDKNNVMRAKKALKRVTKILIQSVRKNQQVVKSSRNQRKMIKSVSGGVMTLVGNNELVFREKFGTTALICEIVFSNCQQVGNSIHPKTLFEQIWKGEHYNQVLHWAKVSQAVRNVNRWAKRQSVFKLKKILKCTKTDVMRLV